jgi:hypothetical protein
MITIILSTVTFLGGVYVGARWADKIKAVWFSIISQ